MNQDFHFLIYNTPDNDGELIENATTENFSVVQKMDSAIPLRCTQNDEDDCHSATSLCHSARSRRIQPEGSNGFRNYVRNDGEIR